MRFRPDGSGLQLYSRGTRNILEAAVSPLLDLFTRDNTNDGGGWDIRFHYFSGMTDHGYPSLFLNSPDEIIKPINDFGCGSGVGATWIDEPGIPAQHESFEAHIALAKKHGIAMQIHDRDAHDAVLETLTAVVSDFEPSEAAKAVGRGVRPVPSVESSRDAERKSA